MLPLFLGTTSLWCNVFHGARLNSIQVFIGALLKSMVISSPVLHRIISTFKKRKLKASLMNKMKWVLFRYEKSYLFGLKT